MSCNLWTCSWETIVATFFLVVGVAVIAYGAAAALVKLLELSFGQEKESRDRGRDPR